MTEHARQHAVVIGSGLAGLAAARVLADHFDRVTVLERDARPALDRPRRCAPQGAHAHALLKRGERIFERLFPGFVDEIEAGGAHCFDFGQGVAWFHHGVWKAHFDSDFPVHVQTRPLIEGTARARLEANERIEFRYGAKVERLLGGRRRITGVALRGGDAPETLEADLVIDATGRGSRLPEWLAAHGVPRARECSLPVDLCYATRVFTPPAGFEADWRALLIYASPPEGTRAGFLFPIEGGRWLVTLVGYLGDHPPADEAGFMRFAASLPQPDLAQALARATPVGGISRYRFHEARQRAYHAVNMPEGVIALGDAVCSFDPVFGQGMTMAARNAELLDTHLRRRRLRSRRWFRSLARLNLVPWLLAATEDLRFPRVTGPRPPGIGLLQSYCRTVYRLCATDTVVYRRFIRVLQMVSGPHVLFHPRVLWAVLRERLRRGERRPALAESTTEHSGMHLVELRR